MQTDADGPRYLPPEPLPRGGTAGAERSGQRRPPGHDLEPPPRQVPMLVRLSALAGGAMTQFGWAFLGFGMIFAWVFFPAAELAALVEFRGEVERVPGIVAACEKTNCSENDTPVYAIHYTFQSPDGRAWQGTSYATGDVLAPGEAVSVEYPKNRPDRSRIVGMRRSPFGLFGMLVAVFPAVGLAFVVAGFARGIKANRLLGRGKLGLGTLKSKEPTNVRINNQRVYKLRFEFKAEDGRTYEAVARTSETQRLEDDQRERVLYDPWNPRYATLMDNLPGSPEIIEGGRLRPRSAARSLAVLVLPAITLIGHGLYVYYGLLR